MNVGSYREAKTKSGESPQEWFVRLQELAWRWITPTEHTVETVLDVIVLEQFLQMVAPEITVWVWERNPKSAAEVARLRGLHICAPNRPFPIQTQCMARRATAHCVWRAELRLTVYAGRNSE
uniref:SCAN box domain-containing protein n=1 Tax=Salmo trutta TaxID=8032 RepID=A0A673XH14_SALTR